MSASLTGQLAYTPLLTTQQHFQLLFFNFHAFKKKKKHPTDTAPLNGKEKKRTDVANYCETFLWRIQRLCGGGHLHFQCDVYLWLSPLMLLFVLTFTGLVEPVP